MQNLNTVDEVNWTLENYLEVICNPLWACHVVPTSPENYVSMRQSYLKNFIIIIIII